MRKIDGFQKLIKAISITPKGSPSENTKQAKALAIDRRRKFADYIIKI